ncbi:hypothetical protein WR25_17763 [Diploscapter pachys]|uniref:SH2 domain-containing protein n=1 Tax=Diploscapter pachys TaxID=2018661 RepID=A0A2A2LPH7_9BILA|nr:hypothetical protein WR25_17763 [Diploscapter pachys]
MGGHYRDSQLQTRRHSTAMDNTLRRLPAVTCCMHGRGCKKGNELLAPESGVAQMLSSNELASTEEAEGDYVDLNRKLVKSQRDTTINASKQFNEQQLSKEVEDAHAAGYYDLVVEGRAPSSNSETMTKPPESSGSEEKKKKKLISKAEFADLKELRKRLDELEQRQRQLEYGYEALSGGITSSLHDTKSATNSTKISYIGKQPELEMLSLSTRRRFGCVGSEGGRDASLDSPIYVDIGPNCPLITTPSSAVSSHDNSSMPPVSSSSDNMDPADAKLVPRAKSTDTYPTQSDYTIDESKFANPPQLTEGKVKVYGTVKTASVKRRYLGTIRMQEAEQNIRKVGEFALYHKMQPTYDTRDLLASAELTMVCQPDTNIFRHYRVKMHHSGENPMFYLEYGDPNSKTFFSLHDLVKHYKNNKTKFPLTQKLAEIVEFPLQKTVLTKISLEFSPT